MPDTPRPTPDTATSRSRRRAGQWDRLAIILLGAAGCALSYDALRQMATAIHVRPQLTYLFPVVIDGFIAYGVRALLVLRQAPMPARLYAWTLFISATAASIWANGLHALDLNQPGAVELHLGDTTVTVLSAIAPLALAGATHLHILISRYAGTERARTPVDGTTTPVPYRQDPTETTTVNVPDQEPEQHDPDDPQHLGPAGSVPATEAVIPCGQGARSIDPDRGPNPSAPKGSSHSAADHETDPGSVPRSQGQGGRPPMATLGELAEVIAAAHPDPAAITRDSARKALTESGLGAATVRLTEAIALVRRAAHADGHPDEQTLVDRT